MPPQDCDHKFVYGGVKYEINPRPRPGTNALYVDYFDWFYCERCLNNRYVRIGGSSNTYQEIKFNATPKAR